jgi:hypothetical protein
VADMLDGEDMSRGYHPVGFPGYVRVMCPKPPKGTSCGGVLRQGDGLDATASSSRKEVYTLLFY